MKFIIRELVLQLNESEDLLPQKTASVLNIDKKYINSIRIVRQSLDARKNSVKFKYSVETDITDKSICDRLINYGYETVKNSKSELKHGIEQIHGRIVVVGAGPCGIIAAYMLAKHGYKPILIERGKSFEQRNIDFELLQKKGILNPESNALFGEGGAGAFSDGKLTTRIKDSRTNDVLNIFVDNGANREITYMAKPHMGTENIRQVINNIRKKIQQLGGDVIFEAKLTNVNVVNGQVTGIQYLKDGSIAEIETNCLVLALGHSARDTYEMLYEKNISMECKPFAVGVRVEHRRDFIDRNQFGKFAGNPRLGAAEYKLTAKSGKRGVYTFCMCPGGEVVCSASEEGYTAVNGMSYFARNDENSNSAIVVSVTQEDVGSSPLSGIEFQRRYEKLAFELAGGYGAPVQKLGDFIREKASAEFSKIKPSYKPYVVKKDINLCLPKYVSLGIKEGFMQFGKMFSGFDDKEAVLTGIETRTSAPLRILRNNELQSVNVKGLYPAGEGAGYAGGIVSAAVDGMKIAEKIIEKFKEVE